MTTNGVKKSNSSSSLDDEDRLSALPEDILHLILSFLHTTQVIKTSLLSTQWRNLWKSHPFIQLSLHPRYKDLKTSIYLHHILRLRNPSSNITKLRFDCHKEPDFHLFHQCIVDAAVNHGAHEIDIMVWHSISRPSIDLNPSIFTLGLVRVFKFADFHNHNGFLISFPNSICSSVHLKFLKLYGIRLPHVVDGDQVIHLICPNLEKLIIKDCDYKHIRLLDISAPQLHKLVIYNPLYSDAFLGLCKLGIHTPKLSSFRYYGSSYVDYSFMEKFPLLASVDITLAAVAAPAFAFDDEDEKQHQAALLYRYVKLLNGLWNAKDLSIEGCVGIFSWIPTMLNKELCLKRFTTLKNLKLRSTNDISSIQGMTYLLLNSCALVESFEWEVCNRYREVEKTVEEYLMLPEFKLCCLKLVKVGRLQGNKNELEFLKFLVKRAVILEEMIISMSDSFISVEVENRRQFKEALTELPWSYPITMRDSATFILSKRL